MLEHFGHPCRLPEPPETVQCDCGEEVYQGDLRACAGCEDDICEECTYTCEICDKKHCRQCVDTDWYNSGWTVCNVCNDTGRAVAELLEDYTKATTRAQDYRKALKAVRSKITEGVRRELILSFVDVTLELFSSPSSSIDGRRADALSTGQSTALAIRYRQRAKQAEAELAKREAS